MRAGHFVNGLKGYKRGILAEPGSKGFLNSNAVVNHLR